MKSHKSEYMGMTSPMANIAKTADTFLADDFCMFFYSTCRSHQLFYLKGSASMFLSLALIIFCGYALSGIFQKLKLPGLLGMLITGIVLGPFALDLISPEIMTISGDLKTIALIVILINAGLSLDIDELKKVGRPALLMCFIPSTFEIIVITILAPIFLKISYLEAAMLGTIVGAVSPAVVVPAMIRIMGEGYGQKRTIPQLVMAGATVNDIYSIVLFTSFLAMYSGEGFSGLSLLKIPSSIILGVAMGIIVGILLTNFFKKFEVRDTIKVMILLATAFAFTLVEKASHDFVSGLIADMTLGATILKLNTDLAKGLSKKFSNVWLIAQLFLFVLVGAAVDIRYVQSAGIIVVVLLLIALVIRFFAAFPCFIKTNITKKERMFAAIAYLPKATVQAAIGGVPLAAGVAAGNTILTVSVIAILLTAPIGAILIDSTYKKLLEKDG